MERIGKPVIGNEPFVGASFTADFQLQFRVDVQNFDK